MCFKWQGTSGFRISNLCLSPSVGCEDKRENAAEKLRAVMAQSSFQRMIVNVIQVELGGEKR